MTREEKSQVIAALKEELAAYNVIYLADISNLNAAATEKLRRACFNAGIRLEVVKNTLLAKAMEASEKDFQGLTEILKGNTALMLTEGAANVPGKLITSRAQRRMDKRRSLSGRRPAQYSGKHQIPRGTHRRNHRPAPVSYPPRNIGSGEQGRRRSRSKSGSPGRTSRSSGRSSGRRVIKTKRIYFYIN